MATSFLASKPDDLRYRTAWYVFIRWYLLLAIGLPGILTLYIAEGWSTEVRRDTLFGIFALLTNLVFYILCRWRRGGLHYRMVPIALIAVDTIFVTYLILTKGGIESRSVILYTVPILMSAAIFGRKAIYITAFASSFLYDMLMYADFRGTVHSLGVRLPDLHTSASYVINTIVFFTALLFIVAATVDFIVRLLIRQEQVATHSVEALKKAQMIAKLGNWEWDVTNNEYTWSPEFYRVFGLDETKVASLDKVVHNLHITDQKWLREEVIRPVKRFMSIAVDHRIRLADGSVRYIHIESRPVYNHARKVVRMIGTVQDLTEQVMLDNAKSDFVSLASHQLRTPATGVKQYVGLLLDGYAGELQPQQRELLKTAYESNERQLMIIDDLLHVAQVDSGRSIIHPEMTNIAALARSVITELRPEFTARDQKIFLHTDVKRVDVEVDKHKFRMVLENLIDNAHKYSLPGSRIDVTISQSDVSTNVVVQDTGVGIAESDIKRLFKKFSRIDNPVSTLVGGTGLGLYWVSRIIEMHGGSIAVESKINTGTSFTITIPNTSTVS